MFVRSGTTWTQQQKLVANDGAGVTEFGSSVALDGDTLVVGAYRDDDKGSTVEASTCSFVRATTWTQHQKLVANDGAAMTFSALPSHSMAIPLVVGARMTTIKALTVEASTFSGCLPPPPPSPALLLRHRLRHRPPPPSPPPASVTASATTSTITITSAIIILRNYSDRSPRSDFCECGRLRACITRSNNLLGVWCRRSFPFLLREYSQGVRETVYFLIL